MKEFFKFSLGCFGIHVVIILAVIIFFKVRYSWETSVNSFYINKLNRYKEAKELIIDNIEMIKKEVNYQPQDTIKYDDGSFYVSKNEYIVSWSKRDLNDIDSSLTLKPIQKLWKDKLLKEGIIGELNIRVDQSIEFFIQSFDHYGSVFSNAYRHYIVYCPGQTPDHYLVEDEALLISRELEKDWYYVVIEHISV